jgi:hypothetical protein
MIYNTLKIRGSNGKEMNLDKEDETRTPIFIVQFQHHAAIFNRAC